MTLEEKMIISQNLKLQPAKLIKWLEESGFRQKIQLDDPGDYHRHGSVVQLWPVDSTDPILVDFFGNQIDFLYAFDPTTNHKLLEIDEIKLIPNFFIGNGDKFMPGDFVVHIDHGIGIFFGLGLKEVEGKKTLYIFIEYENNDKLYVPIELADKISRYIGVGRKPKLSRLGSVSWSNTKKRVYESIIKLAKELLVVAAKRELHPGLPMIGNSEWQQQLSEGFPHTETDDQLKAIDAVLADMTADKPMDRLIIGDVGFGKTEVALRALLQAVSSGYQVALLAPTTLLVEQHFLNFQARLKDFPIRLERLSRLSSSSSKMIADIKNGQIDAIIGTHRLLGKDIGFKKLGLLIVDEEQKFGVLQKERLKKLKESVDVLTLSATPIPRTLFISLSGLRDISRIETPPKGRLPIDTKVERFDLELVKKYILREVKRGGQVFYLHNDVKTMSSTYNQLKDIVPTLRMTIAHGQMPKEELSENMTRFASGEYDLLICSTIIENGLDLPNVNTLIVEEADRFGLSDLYQIRGRIGRSSRQGYSLFTIKNKGLAPNAMKRLKSLAEQTEIGSGFKIALADLEIRGGGNVLGSEQHGNMEAIGLVLYTRLLEQAVQKLK
jgi:transcription-repair coupling factor (superfamily II helicase)